MGGPYLCRPAAVALSFCIQHSRLPDITQRRVMVEVVAVVVGGDGGEEGDKLAEATLSASATPGTHSAHTLSWCRVTTAESQILLPWDRALTTSISIFCFGGADDEGRIQAMRCWNSLACYQTRLLANWTAVNHPQAAEKQEKSHLGINFS